MPALVDLDDPRATDSRLAGGKAAELSRARQAGLRVLPGVVVPAPLSRSHMERGAEALARRGSGGARLEVSRQPLDDGLADELAAAAGGLGDVLVVRSSSVLEAASEWSGAFTSYLEIRPAETARAVAGCWASAFSPPTLERFAATGLDPGSADMAVLVQPALDPSYGGTARLEGDDVVISAVAGSPAPLVQGWEPGSQARVGPEGQPQGAALDLVGPDLIAAVVGAIRSAHAALGATACEWAAVEGEVFILQLSRPKPAAAPIPVVDTRVEGTPAVEVSRLARRYPGPLGEALVLPWTLGEPTAWLDEVDPVPLEASEAWQEAVNHASRLTSEVWSTNRQHARPTAAAAITALRGPAPPWTELAALRPPDAERGRLILGCLATVRSALAEAGVVTWPELGWYLEPSLVDQVLEGRSVSKRQRIGYDRWEPFNAAATMTEGRAAMGAPSAPGLGFGRLRWIAGAASADRFRPRDIIVATHPTPDLAALLWDAAGVVTAGGSPAAHLFDSARALGIPAVSGVHLDEVLEMAPADADGRFALAVDGSSGAAYATPW